MICRHEGATRYYIIILLPGQHWVEQPLPHHECIDLQLIPIGIGLRKPNHFAATRGL